MVLAQLLAYLREIAPEETAFDKDPVGHLIGSEDGAKTKEITRVGVCLDATLDVVERAIAKGVQCLIAHHPLIYRPLRQIGDDPIALICRALVRADMDIYAMHTNWDAAPEGINDTLARELLLTEIRPLATHGNARIARIGKFAPPMTVSYILEEINEHLVETEEICHVRMNLDRKNRDRLFETVAVCGGAGAEFVPEVIAAGAEVFITSDVRHHEFLDATARGLLLIDAGHMATETPGMKHLANLIGKQFPLLRVEYFYHSSWP